MKIHRCNIRYKLAYIPTEDEFRQYALAYIYNKCCYKVNSQFNIG